MGNRKHTTAMRRAGMKRHACQRARERWDVHLTPEDIVGLNYTIRLGLGRPIEKNSKKRGLKFFVTTLDWKRIPVVYNEKFKCIATVLAPQAAEVQRAIAKRERRQRQPITAGNAPAAGQPEGGGA